jgi:DNA-binding transcriptional regulator PaaX
MARKSRLLQVLRLAEDFLLFFDDYFRSTSWVYDHAGLSYSAKVKSKRHLKKNGIIKDDFFLDLPEKSVYELITKPWDEKWRMINFDIPEESRNTRDKIRYSLRQLGFKNLQRSLLVSPLPVDKFIDDLRKELDDPHQMVILVGELKGQSSHELVKQLWNLDEWREEADFLTNRLEEDKKDMQEIERDFWDIIADHPKVPLALLPSNWPLNSLVAAFTQAFKPNGQEK